MVRHLAEELEQRFAVGVHVEPDEAGPGVDADLAEAALVVGDAVDEVLLVGHTGQRPVDVERPEVEGALDLLRVAAAQGRAQAAAAVRADVVEALDRVRRRAHEDERLAPDRVREVVTHLGDIGDAPGVEPDLRPHPIPLQLGELGRGVAARVDQVAAQVGLLGDAVDGRLGRAFTDDHWLSPSAGVAGRCRRSQGRESQAAHAPDGQSVPSRGGARVAPDAEARSPVRTVWAERARSPSRARQNSCSALTSTSDVVGSKRAPRLRCMSVTRSMFLPAKNGKRDRHERH